MIATITTYGPFQDCLRDIDLANTGQRKSVIQRICAMDRLSAGECCSISSNFIIGQGIRLNSGSLVKRQGYIYDCEQQPTLPEQNPIDRAHINAIMYAKPDLTP